MAEVAPTGASAPTPAANVLGGALAGIAKRNEEIRSEAHLDLQVPGYEGQMKVRYRLLPEAEMDRLGRRIEDVKRGEGVVGAWKIEADSLVAMCDRIYVRAPGEDEYQVLEDGTGPVRFEGRFAQILGKAGVKVNGAKATEIVLDFFSPRAEPENPASPRLMPNAMETHTNAIFAWSRGERENISRKLLGE